MKTPFILAVVITLFLGGVAFAQEQTILPKAGLTPESPFYFFDRLGEAIQEFLTFNPQSKARLQITFAAERVAEITIVLETKGVDAKGLEVAQSRLQANLAKAATIVADQKSKGKDVSSLAKELDDKFEAPKSALAQTFKAQERKLKQQEDELKAQLREAHRAGDIAQEEAIASQLGQVKAQLELLELKEEDIESDLEAEEEKIEEEIEAEEKAEKAIREAEEEKEEIIDEAAEEGTELPADAFAEFDSLLAQAQSALQAGNFPEAVRLAKQAERSLETIEDVIEELEETEELKEEAEEAIEEAEEELAEVEADAQEDGVDVPADAFGTFNSLLSQAKSAFAAESFKEAKRLAEQAEKALDDAEKTIEKLKKEKEQKEEQAKEEEEQKQEQEERQKEEESEEQKIEQPLVQPKVEAREFEISGKEFSFSPSSITVKSGQKVKIKFRNHGGVVHNLILEGLGVGTKTIKPGDDASFEFTAPSQGTYTLFCSVGNHRQFGMEGKLIVE